MSATGRSDVRRVDDLYETPAWLTRALLPHLESLVEAPTPWLALEPACGNGAIIETLPHAVWTALDIAPGANVPWAQRADFLTLEPQPVYDLVLSNPPYSLAEEFCRRAMLWVKPQGVVVMLLRLNFLESQKRAMWLRSNTPSVYVSPKRPSFTGKGTDATGYGWFVWKRGATATLKILETEKKKDFQQ